MKHRYLSVLKQKAGEVDAVRDLAVGIWDRWNPLFELMSGELDEDEDPSELVSRLVHGVQRSCRTGATIFLDFEAVELPQQGGAAVVTSVLQDLTNAGFELIPIVQLTSSADIRGAVTAFLGRNGGRFGFRVYLEEMTPALNAQATGIVDQLGATIAQSFLLVDLEEIPSNYVQQLTVVLPGLFALIPSLEQWQSVTLIGTGVPRILGIPAGSNAVLPRTELELFNQIRGSIEPMVTRLDFGDYTVSHPELVDFDPVTMQVSPKILYTTDGAWITYKGRSTRRYSWDQTHDMCAQLIARPEFRGAAFSSGDAYIANCAVRSVSRGNGRTWKKVGTNHHITFVADQIANLLGA